MQQHLASSEVLPLRMRAVPLRREEHSAASAAPAVALSPLPSLAPSSDERRLMGARIRRLRRKSLLTPDALTRLGQSDLSTQTLHALLTLLEGPFEERFEERAACAWALGLARLTPRQQETVTHTLCGVLRRKTLVGRVHARQGVDPVVAWLLSSMGLWIGLDALIVSSGSRFVVGPVSMGCCALVVSVLAARALRRSLQAAAFSHENRLRATTAMALGRIGSVSAIGTLTRAALDANAGVRRAAYPALQACLARLTPLDASRMDADVQPNLCRLLDRAREQRNHDSDRAEAMALSVLDALRQIGDGRAAPNARALINTGWTAPVNHAAKELLPLLLARRQQETDQRVLLRPTAMPAIAPNTLLRPTGSLAEVEAPATLLRPHQS